MMLIEKPIIIIQLGFPAKLPFPGVLGDRISGCIVLVNLWSSEAKLYHWVSSLLQPDLPILQRSRGFQHHGSRGNVMEVSSFQGKYKNRECQDQKEPKIYHNLSNSEPMISSSTLTSACPQLHFRSSLLVSEWFHHLPLAQVTKVGVTWGLFPSPPPSSHMQPAPYVLSGPFILLQLYQFLFCSNHYLSSDLTTGP